MAYILVMAVSGSTMTVLFRIMRRLLINRACAHLYDLLARAAILYYLVPLWFLKGCYGKVIRVSGLEEQMKIAQIPLVRTSYAVHADGRLYANIYADIQRALVLIWLSVACLLMVKQLLAYLRTARKIAAYTAGKMTDTQERFVNDIKARYRVKRRVLLYEGKAGEPTMTFGVCRPVIICGKETGTREAELMVSHEIIHIRHMDAFWKMLIHFVMFLHWWNPIMWMLYRDFDCVYELSCDETVMRGKSKEEIKEYLRLLIEEARKEGETARPTIRWKARFGEHKREIRERMDNLMKKKKWNRFAVGTLAAALIFANSLTVFAYQDTFHEYLPEDVSEETIENRLQSDLYQFVPDGIAEEEAMTFEPAEVEKILYDAQFTDEEGNIYQIPDASPQWGCDHTFVSGTSTIHRKTSGGGCVVEKYRSKRCSQCGIVECGDFISSTTYAVCPH